MKIKKAFFNNIKSFKDPCEIDFEKDINFLIGTNSGGKSNLLEIIQGVINDLILMNININKNSENTRESKFYKVENLTSNRDNFNNQVLDKFFDKESDPQEIKIYLEIEKTDIENIDLLKSIKNDLISFEETNVTGATLKGYFDSIDFNLDFSNLVGEILEISITDKSLNEPVDQGDKRFRQFYYFLRYSNAFANFIRVYNNHTKKAVAFKPYFIYIPPNRISINLSQFEEIINLQGSDSFDLSFFKQVNQTQDSSLDVYTLLKRKLVENFYFNKPRDNDFFKNNLKEVLGLDFVIRKRPEPFALSYGITFFRTNQKGSPKLSSGEKEYINLIANVFVHNIEGGVILIDEPELHLHPRWQKRLVELFNTLSRERNIQLIMVTHSPQFVRAETLKKIIRVYKLDGSSKTVMPDKRLLSTTSIKDTFLIVTATNNEKMFFADKVILVEGEADRIIFESVLKKIQSDLKNKDIIEIVNVLGKKNFERFEKFLDIWEIPKFTIADLDYLKEIGSAEIKQLFVENDKKLRDSLIDSKSKDALTLIDALKKITKLNKEQINETEFNDLCELTNFLILKHSSLKLRLSQSEKKLLDDFISLKVNEKVYLLAKGEIEDYFSKSSKFDIADAIQIDQEIKNNSLRISIGFKRIIKNIIQNA